MMCRNIWKTPTKGLMKLLKSSKDLEGFWRIIIQAHSKEENHGNMDTMYYKRNSKIYERICEDIYFVILEN